jgi:hypothetical protein
MAIRKSSSSGIPFGLNAGRPASPSYGQLYSNGETARLEIYTQASGWQNIVQETPGVASATGHYYQSDGSGTFIVSGTNFVSGAIAYAVGTNGIEYQAQTTTYNSLVQLTVVFSNLSAAYEPYDIKVTNPSNLFGLLPDAFYINESPIWTTSAGNLATINMGSALSVSVAATDAESNTITYASSDKPSWITLNSSTGLLNGTAPDVSSNTVYSFTVTASDGINAPISRIFTVTNNALGTGGTITTSGSYRIHTFTSSGSFYFPSSKTVDYLVVAGGGGGGNYGGNAGGGGGAGGLRSTVTATGGGGTLESSLYLTSGTYNVVVGAGGAAATDKQGYPGVDSSFHTITSKAGSGGGSAAQGGSGGGGNLQNSGTGYGAGGAGTTGQGYAGGNGLATSYDAGGGGGGAGAAGVNGINTVGGNGGVGIATSINGTSTYYAGGGGGGVYPGGSSVTGSGGNGGGGNGGLGTGAASAGTTNRGGGGGGSGTGNSPATGGSGIVIIRYAV